MLQHCFDVGTMLQQFVMMYEQCWNDVLTIFSNVIKCSTMCDVTVQ